MQLNVAGGAKIFLDKACCMQSKREFAVDAKMVKLLKELIDLKFVESARMENFYRQSSKARMAQLLAIMAINDAQIHDAGSGALIAWNGTSCISENRRYFSDYLQFNRESGQGKLFVATLPSTPAAEAAIAINLQGAVFYYGGHEFSDLLTEIELETHRHSLVLAMEIFDDHGVALVFVPGKKSFVGQTLSDIFSSIYRGS